MATDGVNNTQNKNSIEFKNFSDEAQDMFLNLNTTTMDRVNFMQKHMENGELSMYVQHHFQFSIFNSPFSFGNNIQRFP